MTSPERLPPDFTQATRSSTVLAAIYEVATDNSVDGGNTLLASVFPFRRPVRLLGIALPSLNTEES